MIHLVVEVNALILIVYSQTAHKEVIIMSKKEPKPGTPKKDGSGKGTGANKGRGGCKSPKGDRKGRNR